MKAIVTVTESFQSKAPWGSNILVEDEREYCAAGARKMPLRIRSFAKRWLDFQFSLRILRRAVLGNYPAIAVGRHGVWVAVLNYLFRLNKRVVVTDQEWFIGGSGIIDKLTARGSVAMCGFTTKEINAYVQYRGIPPDKFRLVLLSYQEHDLYPPSDEGFIFAGGNEGRDWKVFFEAVSGLPYPVRVFTARRSTLPDVLPENVTVATVSRSEFYQQMAAASCVAVPVLAETLRVTGDTVWTNAMAMGKVVVTTEDEGAPDYMENGVSGLIVPRGDSACLREAILKVMGNPELRQRIGQAARERAERDFSPDAFRRQILNLLSGS